MNFQQSMALNQYVEENREYLNRSDRPTQSQMASNATAALGFKVSVGALAQAMRFNGIETKHKSKKNAKVEALEAENARLTSEVERMRKGIAKVLAGDVLPADLKDYIIGNLPQELRRLLRGDEQEKVSMS